MFHNKDICRPPSLKTQILFRILCHFHISTIVGEILKHPGLKIDHITIMVGENFEISKYGMAEIGHKSTMAGHKGMEWAGIDHISTMVGENFEISRHGMS